MTDVVLDVMFMLKNNWAVSLSNTGSNLFSTSYYDESLSFPQVCVTQIEGDPSPPLTMGSSGSYYKDTDILSVDIWVRPLSDNNTSYGQAKNTIYIIRKEVERILRSGSYMSNDENGYSRFLWLGPWRKQPLLQLRKVPLHNSARVNVVRFVKGVP